MNLPYELIACDLDETLLSTDCTICQRNLDAIAKAVALGIKFTPATGRGFADVIPVLRTLGLDRRSDQYVISFNGGAITENLNSRILSIRPISFDLCEKICEFGFAQDICMHVYTDAEVYVRKPTPSELAFLEHRLQFLPLENSISFLRNRNIVKILFMDESENYSRLRQMRRDMGTILSDCEISYSSNRYLEFNSRNSDKGHGLLKLAEILGIPAEKTIAIGDNINDEPMIQAAGLGVGVANAYAHTRSVCDIITESDSSHGAVGEVIEKYILNMI